MLKKNNNKKTQGWLHGSRSLSFKEWPVLTKRVWTPHAKNVGNQLLAKRHTHCALTIPTKPSFLRELERLPVSRTDEVDFKTKRDKKKENKKNHNFSFIIFFTMTPTLNKQRRAPIRSQSY